MHLFKNILRAICSLLLAIIPATAQADSRVDVDNSKLNKTYNGTVSSTADQQSNAKAAMETTRRIRKALMANKSLSTYAHNVKIIAQNGEVVLKGPVESAEEKQTVETTAARESGGIPVRSELAVTAH